MNELLNDVLKFNLRDKKAKGLTMIQLLFMFHSKRVRMTTGISCFVKDWNDKKQRLYDRFEILNAKEHNQHLNKLESSIILLLEDLKRKERVLSIVELKQSIRENCFHDSINASQNLFWVNFDSFVKFKSGKVKEIFDYDRALRKHLKAVELKLSRNVVFSDFHRHSDFLSKFDNYLRHECPNIKGDNGLAVNTIGKQYKNLKVFLNWCFDEQIIQPFSLRHLVTERVDIDTVYLSEQELKKIDELVLTGSIDICRDLFLIGCETGLRFSDFRAIQPQQIKNGMLEVRPKKTRNSTNTRILIPLSNRVKNIVNKYYPELPSWPEKRLNDFNVLIKKCAKLAQLNEIHSIEKQTGGNTCKYELQKWELISSHTCRRTFCTLKFLNGMPSHVIMKFSGHSTEKNFLKYLKLDAELNADKYRSYFQ